jgi:NAD(P)-dependent dehydrogenase (short-subunit alcohol dehydrogenase family)
MGLAVAEALETRGNWKLHLLDVNENAGSAVVKKLGSAATFHKTDVTNYSSLAQVFGSIFKAEGRLDFVFANAGVVERWNFYANHEQSPPPEPDHLTTDINLKAVINTSYLAQHYFRLSPPGDKSLVMTGSTGALVRVPI